MCGIVAYIGQHRNVPKLLIDGLQRLEYRGYDSAGIAFHNGEKVFCKKKKRPTHGSAVFELGKVLPQKTSGVLVGISHTRWATHGEPACKNAHPHTDCHNNIYLVHNGIIENFSEIKKALSKQGHHFTSKTDTEVLAHLIEDNYTGDLREAVFKSLAEVEGAFGLAVFHADNPQVLVSARRGSPIGIGVCDSGFIVASDASPIMAHTREVIYLEDDEIVTLQSGKYEITSLVSKRKINRQGTELDLDYQAGGKGRYAHYMLKEICEQPQSLQDSIRGRVDAVAGKAVLGGLHDHKRVLRQVDNIITVSCGTAYYAGMVGEYMFEEMAGVPMEVDFASEFRYRSASLPSQNTSLLAISQSGETADTLAAIKEAKTRGVPCFGVVNTVGSSIARETDAGIYNHAGPEVGVASTKAFTSQLMVLALMSLYLGRQRGLSVAEGITLAKGIKAIPGKVKKIIDKKRLIKKIAHKYANYNDFLFIGRKYNFPIAMEGALKLKEISYIHAEGYGAGEMKHGPLALIDEDFPTVCIVPNNSVRDKMISNMQEIKARSGNIIAIGTEGDKELENLADDVFYIPKTEECLEPLLTVIPLQLLAYYISIELGRDVDKPRNLAKSVTVE